MKLAKIQDFEVWKKADAFSDAVTAILTRPAFGRNCKLLEQIEDALDSITSNMSEGFEQSTDRGFAKYLFTAKGSTAETCTRLARASRRGCLSKAELRTLEKQAEEIGRMLTGLIKHLMKTPNRRRGLGARINDLELTAENDSRLDTRSTDSRLATDKRSGRLPTSDQRLTSARRTSD